MKSISKLIDDLHESHPSVVNDAMRKLVQKGEKAFAQVESLFLNRIKQIRKGEPVSPVTENVIAVMGGMKNPRVLDHLFSAMDKAVEAGSVILIDAVAEALERLNEKIPFKYYAVLNRALETAVLEEEYDLTRKMVRLFKLGGDRRTVNVLRKVRLRKDRSNLSEYLSIIKLSMAVEAAIKTLPKSERPQHWRLEDLLLEWL